MKRSFGLLVGIVTAVVAFHWMAVGEVTGPRGLLVAAYGDLATANDNYAGHRIAALKHLQEAGDALHLDLRGAAKGHERQRASDEQLRDARRLLERAQTELERRDRERVARHVDDAIHEIDRALQTK